MEPDEIAEIWKEGYVDPVFFCKFFLPHKFPEEMPWVHRGILAIITRKCDFLQKYGELDKIITNFVWQEDPEDTDSPFHPIFRLDDEGVLHMEVSKYSLVMMPRGFSKTTLVGQACVLYMLLYKDYKFPVYLSETATHANTQLLNVKRELETNVRIKAVFGDLKPDQRSGSKWAEDFIQPTNGSAVVSRGRGGQVRGLNVDGTRPDFILFDDVENKESVSTEEQRAKTREWLFADVMPAQDEANPAATIVGLGTLLHREALLMTLMKDPEWTVIKFGAVDRQGELLWEFKMDHEKLERKKMSYARAGLLHLFYMEFHNELHSAETQIFKPEYLRVLYVPVGEFDHKALAMDPAISEKKRADYATLCVVGVKRKGQFSVLDFWAKKGPSPRELIDKFMELQAVHKTRYNGIESIAYQAALVHLMREEQFRKKQYFEITPLTHSQKKVERVEGILGPRFASGVITFNKPFPLLQTQLADWPNGKMDGPDVLAMAISLLDPHAPLAAIGEDGKDLDEDEYEPLGNWGYAP